MRCCANKSVYHWCAWSSYMWDMKNKVINIIDPQCSNGTASYMKEKHQVCADIIHEALFDCIKTFFSNWICDHNIGWSKKFLEPTHLPLQR